MTATTSAPLTASAIEAAGRPPAASSGPVLPGCRLQPTTSKPASARWTDIGLPIMPSPMKAMVVTIVLLGSVSDLHLLR